MAVCYSTSMDKNRRKRRARPTPRSAWDSEADFDGSEVLDLSTFLGEKLDLREKKHA